MARKIPGGAIQANTISITQLQTTVVSQIQSGASGGPKISAITYPNSATAAANTGSETITLTGTGFESGVTVIVNGNVVPSVTRTNANSLSFTTAALSSTTYPVYVVNPDGGTAIFINPGLRVSGKPIWVTTSPLLSWGKAAALSRTFQANSDSAVTYSLAGGSSLPSGLTLAANGLLSGTLTSPPANNTTYNFTVVATDAENQTTSSAFSIDAISDFATGGTVSNVGSYRIHTFTSTGTFEVFSNINVEYLIIAGGGGGGGHYGGGGGAGGFRTGSNLSVNTGTYTVTVGGGGAQAKGYGGTTYYSGSNSSALSLTSTGGGYGGGRGGLPAASGGSGGGGGGGLGGASSGSATPGQGNNGGGGYDAGSSSKGGGGGGAGAAGQIGDSGGNGGNGSASSISGSSVTYAGGGGGSGGSPSGGTGGTGGGGGGVGNPMSANGVSGTTNTGGGGGGAGQSEGTSWSGAGGSGIVIIRYLV